MHAVWKRSSPSLNKSQIIVLMQKDLCPRLRVYLWHTKSKDFTSSLEQLLIFTLVSPLQPACDLKKQVMRVLVNIYFDISLHLYAHANIFFIGYTTIVCFTTNTLLINEIIQSANHVPASCAVHKKIKCRCGSRAASTMLYNKVPYSPAS